METETETEKGAILLSTCRACSNSYSYALCNGQTVTILVEIPPTGIKYKAISHVWGATIPIQMHCKKCSSAILIPLRGISTFTNIMALAGPGSTIWLDNMSIDQKSHEEKATVVAVMGEIYSNAELVSVLLPAEDQDAFKLLQEIVGMASTLLERKWRFDYRIDESVGLEGDEDVSGTAALARNFWTGIKQLLDCEVKYWQRAWTFQECALAHDIEISCDIASSKDRPTVIKHVKSTTVFAAVIIADHKLRFGQWALMDVGFNRGEIINRIDFINILFPFKDAFASFEELDQDEHVFQCALPHFGTNQILGLRSTPRAVRTEEEEFRARLMLMLDVFATNEIRTATHEADLVCCWASMCNIQYEYSSTEELSAALGKVIRAIRKRGVQIHNFHVNGDEIGMDVDLEFFKYAAANQLTSSTCLARIQGAPIFTGWTDTAHHFHRSIANPPVPMVWPTRGRFYQGFVKDVKRAFIIAAIPLTTRVYAIGYLIKATSGIADGTSYTNALLQIDNMLRRLPTDTYDKHAIVIAAIPTSDSDEPSYFCSWTVISLYMPIDSLFIAREELNGTLVLAAMEEGTISNTASIFAYLTITDHQCGTALIKPHTRDRRLQAQLQFADNTKLSSESRAHIGMHGAGMVYDKRVDDIECLAKFSTNDPVIRPFGPNPGIAIAKLALERLNVEPENHSPVNLDIIGHPHLIPLVQRTNEAALRLKASLPREENKNIRDRLKIVQISTASGRTSMTVLEGTQIGAGIPGFDDVKQ